MPNGSWGVKAVFTNLFMAASDRRRDIEMLKSHWEKKALIVNYLLERREGCNLKMKL